MYCPRCGSPNEPGDRFCSSCGATLTEGTPENPPSARERIRQLLGTDRRTRLITAATVIAIVVAVAAFIALGEKDKGTIPRDAYTIAADQMCVAAKRQIAATEHSSGGADENGTAGVARRLLPVVAGWRSEFDALKVPSDRLEQARALDDALREVEVRIGALARAAEENDRKQVITRAGSADEASTRVEEAVSGLGLGHCGSLTIGLSEN